MARRVTLALAAALVVFGLAFHTGSGTLSSFGWKAIAAVCPLGGVEAFLATWTFVPPLLVGLGVFVAVSVLFGKVFCAWLCPVPPLKRFFSFVGRRGPARAESAAEERDEQGEGASTVAKAARGKQAATAHKKGRAHEGDHKEPAPACTPAPAPVPEPVLTCSPAGCASCAHKRRKLDSRHLVLLGALVSTAVFGFPVFCVVCPVGLTFASIIAVWRLVGFNEPSLSLLVYPAIIVIELLVLRKWCHSLCPLGALFSLLSIPNRLFRPRVDKNKCLRSKGIDCTVCVDVCEEGLDPHYREGMHECTKCGLCKEKCPSTAITLPLRPAVSKEAREPVSK